MVGLHEGAPASSPVGSDVLSRAGDRWMDRGSKVQDLTPQLHQGTGTGTSTGYHLHKSEK